MIQVSKLKAQRSTRIKAQGSRLNTQKAYASSNKDQVGFMHSLSKKRKKQKQWHTNIEINTNEKLEKHVQLALSSNPC